MRFIFESVIRTGVWKVGGGRRSGAKGITGKKTAGNATSKRLVWNRTRAPMTTERQTRAQHFTADVTRNTKLTQSRSQWDERRYVSTALQILACGWPWWPCLQQLQRHADRPKPRKWLLCAMLTSHDGKFSRYIIHRLTALTGAAVFSLVEFLRQPESSTECIHKECGRKRRRRQPTDLLSMCGGRGRVCVVLRQPTAYRYRCRRDSLQAFRLKIWPDKINKRNIMSIRASGCCV
jgi:hypothetical protein